MNVLIKNLSFWYEELEVLRDISLTIQSAESIAVVGPSGCGKTTFLRCIAGVLSPSGGNIELEDGKSPTEARGRLAFVFQEPVFFPWLTVSENLELPHQLSGSTIRAEEISRALREFGIVEFEEYLPEDLSIGMAQRMCLARSLARQPELLLLDEPVGALDEINRERICVDLSRTTVDVTVVMVTHNIHDAVFFGDRVVVFGGRPAEIIEVVDVEWPQPRSRELWLSSKLNKKMVEVRRAMELADRND